MAEFSEISIFFNPDAAADSGVLATKLAEMLAQLLKKLSGITVPVSTAAIGQSDDAKTGQYAVYLLSQGDAGRQDIVKKINDRLEKNTNVAVFFISTGARPALIRTIRIYDLNIDPSAIAGFKMEQAPAVLMQSLVDLTYELSVQIQTKETSGKKVTVFVAETTPDMEAARQEIIRELHDFGYTVTPSAETSTEYNKCKEETEKMIPSADMFIHIIGGEYGAPLKQSAMSKIDLQHQLVNAHLSKQQNRSTERCRYIWISAAIKHASKEHLVFVENMKHDSEQLFMAEIVQTPLEKFKSIMMDRLRERENLGKISTNQRDQKHSIYHLFEKDDSTQASSVAETLKTAGFDVKQPDFSRSFSRMDSHWKNLSECDAVLIQYSGNNDAWVSSKLNDIVKAPGYGRIKPFRALGLYLAQNKSYSSTGLVKDIMIIRQEQAFAPVLLEPFVKKIG